MGDIITMPVGRTGAGVWRYVKDTLGMHNREVQREYACGDMQRCIECVCGGVVYRVCMWRCIEYVCRAVQSRYAETCRVRGLREPLSLSVQTMSLSLCQLSLSLSHSLSLSFSLSLSLSLYQLYLSLSRLCVSLLLGLSVSVPLADRSLVRAYQHKTHSEKRLRDFCQ